MREVEEDHGDPRALANKFDQILERAKLAIQESALLAWSEELATGIPKRYSKAPSKSDLLPNAAQEQTLPLAEIGSSTSNPAAAIAATEVSCKDLTEPLEHLICADADLAFWQNLVSEIYQHKWQQLDANGQQILHQGQLDWLGNMRVNCYVAPETGAWNAAEMARAKSCVLQSTKERVVVLTNN